MIEVLLDLSKDYPWVGSAWFIWVTFHDLVQWAVMALLGFTVLRQRRVMKDMVRKEVAHIHEELHKHIEEDIELHDELGQPQGLSEGKWLEKE